MEGIIRLLRNDRRGVSNVLVVMLSLVLITVIVANVILWSYQMNQFDWEKSQEKIEISNFCDESPWLKCSPYWKFWEKDNIYETFTEENAPQNREFYPFQVNLLAGTQIVEGSINDLTADDNSHIIFRSYEASGIKKGAFIAYRSNTGTFGSSSPKARTWDGEAASWGPEEELPNAGDPVVWVRVAYCPLQNRAYEKIVVTLLESGDYNVYVWNGTQWLIFSNIGYNAYTSYYRSFDVAYEKSYGRALIVYSRGTAMDGYEIGYRIWDGNNLSDEYLLDLTYTYGIVHWISLATAPGTRPGTADDNEIAMIYLDSNRDVQGYIWNGSSWSDMGAASVWDSSAATYSRECIAVAYEQISGRAMFIWGHLSYGYYYYDYYNYYRIWDGSALSDPLSLRIAAQGGITYWVTLKPNPVSNGLMFVAIDSGRDLNTAYWDGTSWTIHNEHDWSVDTSAQRCADFAWEPDGNRGLLVWGTSYGAISYKIFTIPNTWSPPYTASAAGTHRWVQLKTNTQNIEGDIRILGAVLNSNYDIGVI
ncbi:hypothetical protein H5T51_07200, partial [Candidatus Bathyarchaeota archaeon]|nr:hypothetical protein [Candidatus Bathyarchaeota archaeon]